MATGCCPGSDGSPHAARQHYCQWYKIGIPCEREDYVWEVSQTSARLRWLSRLQQQQGQLMLRVRGRHPERGGAAMETKGERKTRLHQQTATCLRTQCPDGPE